MFQRCEIGESLIVERHVGNASTFPSTRQEVLKTYLELFGSLYRQFRPGAPYEPRQAPTTIPPMGSAGADKPRDVCQRKRQLAESLRVAMDDIIALSIRERDAMIAQDLALLKVVRDRLEKARNRKDSLLIEYQKHITSHGC